MAQDRQQVPSRLVRPQRDVVPPPRPEVRTESPNLRPNVPQGDRASEARKKLDEMFPTLN